MTKLKPPASPETVELIFRNLFNGGPLRGLPRNRNHAEVVLAMAAAWLDGTVEYSESDLNDVLAEWLVKFSDPLHLDHVTVRRYLVDTSMVLRDAEGKSYRVNQPVVNQIIELQARSVQPSEILYQVQMERQLRRQKRDLAR